MLRGQRLPARGVTKNGEDSLIQAHFFFLLLKGCNTEDNKNCVFLFISIGIIFLMYYLESIEIYTFFY